VSKALPVTYLFNRDCPSHEAGRELLAEASDASGIPLSVTVVEVFDDDQARRLRFHGSPTFVLAGEDPFPPPEGVAVMAQACRAYARSDGRMGPLPTLADLVAALEAARARTQGAPA
jgi:hypothetical protein